MLQSSKQWAQKYLEYTEYYYKDYWYHAFIVNDSDFWNIRIFPFDDTPRNVINKLSAIY